MSLGVDCLSRIPGQAPNFKTKRGQISDSKNSICFSVYA